MAADIQIDVQEDDVERVLGRLDSLFSPLGMMGFLSTSVSPFIRQRARARFAAEGDDVVGKWLPLAPATEEFRSRMEHLGIGAAHPINRRTDDLYDYITNSPDAVSPLPGGAQLRYPANDATGWLGVKVATAQGGKAKPSTPPRPVLGLGVQDLAYVIGALGIAVRKAGAVR